MVDADLPRWKALLLPVHVLSGNVDKDKNSQREWMAWHGDQTTRTTHAR